MRELIYAVEGKAANLKTFALDESGHGGACHEYQIEGPLQPAGGTGTRYGLAQQIKFQNGPINANGVNGIQMEDLIAICIDRLEGFQKGVYACDENGLALDACKEVLGHLQTRTKKRIARSVEGTHTV